MVFEVKKAIGSNLQSSDPNFAWRLRDFRYEISSRRAKFGSDSCSRSGVCCQMAVFYNILYVYWCTSDASERNLSGGHGRMAEV